MKQRTNSLLICMLSLCFALFACNQEAKTDETKTDSTKTDKMESSDYNYDRSMDAPSVTGYPAKVLADSLNLKMYEFVANPGDTVPMHTHPDHALYVVEGGKVEITGKDGNVQVLEVKPGMGIIFGNEQHSAKNTGSTRVKLLIVHVYRPRG